MLLADQHLMAEYRELPMVHKSLNRSLNSKKGINFNKNIDYFKLDSGHVYSFYFRGKWLFKRYRLLINELKRRNYNILSENRDINWSIFKENTLFWKDWMPTEADENISKERIKLRLLDKVDWYKYQSKPLLDNKLLKYYYEL